MLKIWNRFFLKRKSVLWEIGSKCTMHKAFFAALCAYRSRCRRNAEIEMKIDTDYYRYRFIEFWSEKMLIFLGVEVFLKMLKRPAGLKFVFKNV